MTGKVIGPQSYFPAIEAKCGQPVEHWIAMVKAVTPARHMELVALLKAAGLGHGHANAVVAFALAQA
jgi:hypothetical protein